MAQSATRKLKRQMLGLQNTVPHSTKISKHTKNGKKEGFVGYRTNRFAIKPISFKILRVECRIAINGAIKAKLAS